MVHQNYFVFLHVLCVLFLLTLRSLDAHNDPSHSPAPECQPQSSTVFLTPLSGLRAFQNPSCHPRISNTHLSRSSATCECASAGGGGIRGVGHRGPTVDLHVQGRGRFPAADRPLVSRQEGTHYPTISRECFNSLSTCFFPRFVFSFRVFFFFECHTCFFLRL